MTKLANRNNNLEVLNSVIKDNNAYTAVRLIEEDQQKKLYWVWGKIDFISMFKPYKDVWLCYKVLLVNKKTTYEFVETTFHGTMFNETKWISTNNDIFYIELPKNFSYLMFDISNQLLTELKKNYTH